MPIMPIRVKESRTLESGPIHTRCTTGDNNTSIGYLTTQVRLVYNTPILEYEQVMPHTPSRRYMR